MSRFLKIFLLALLLLAGIAALSDYLSGADLQGRFSFGGASEMEEGVLLEAAKNVDAEFEPGLGTEQVVMKFGLRAANDLTVRYIPLMARVSGYDLAVLGDAQNWKVYELNSKTGEPDYSRQVGVGSDVYTMEDTLYLRLRLFGDLQTSGYRVTEAQGATDLAVVSKLLSSENPEDERVLILNFADGVDNPYTWSWALGDNTGTAWALVEEKRSLEGLSVN